MSVYTETQQLSHDHLHVVHQVSVEGGHIGGCGTHDHVACEPGDLQHVGGPTLKIIICYFLFQIKSNLPEAEITELCVKKSLKLGMKKSLKLVLHLPPDDL
jgi:hypothetical protein